MKISESTAVLEERNLFIEQKQKFHPGDKIKFNVKYDGFNPNENHEIYLNIHTSDGTDKPIVRHFFKSSKTGSGMVHIEWKVPHDSTIMQNDGEQKEMHFSTHSSARLDRFYTKEKIHLSQRRDSDSNVFQYPRDGSVVPTHKVNTVKWDKNEMKYFKHIPGTDGMGADKISSKVSLIIVAINGNFSSAFQLANGIDNNGTYDVRFPEFLHLVGRDFFMVIHDFEEYSKMAWNKGTFKLEPIVRNQRNKIPVHPIRLDPVYIEPPIVENRLPLWGSARSVFTIPVAPAPAHVLQNNGTHRELITGPSTCPSTSLSIMLQIEFGFDGFTLLGKTYTLGSTHSNPFTVVPQTNFCI